VSGVEPAASEMRPLRVGERVRSTNDEPMFASDPKAGDVGRVIQTSASSSLVRWADGSESWAARTSLEPLQIGDPIAAGFAAGGTPLETSVPGMPLPPKRPTPKLLRIPLTLAPLLFLILTFLPALVRLVRHPTLPRIVFVGLAAAAIIVVVTVSRHRNAAKAATPDPDTTGTLDGE
jgi:hypothetical protein